MSRALAVLALAALALGGCTSWPMFREPAEPARLLAEADDAAEHGDYERALKAYDVYLARYPDYAEAQRVVASRDAVAALVATRAELARLRRELAARDAEVARLREELARVRADLERIMEIDLKRDLDRHK